MNPKAGSDIYQRISHILKDNGIELFGVADLSGISGVPEAQGVSFPRALSFAVPMNPRIMIGIKQGPNQAYAQEYTNINNKITAVSAEIERFITGNGYHAKKLQTSKRTDPVNIKGDFPHKTAATLAGLGWIGRNCQLVTRRYGPWVRLGTVFTDLPVECGKPVDKSYCGKCTVCIEACPAGALGGSLWEPGIDRKKLLDVFCCDKWKKENYYQFHKGHNCGICSAVCPFGKG